MTRNKWLTVALALAIPVVAFASGTLELRADNAGATVLTVKHPTATYPLMQVNTSGLIEWGSGSAVTDTNLYRSTADTLKTDDALTVLGTLTASGDLTGDGGDQLVGYLNNHVTASTTALTAAQCGSTVINTGAVVQPLPEASTVLGCRYTFAAGTDDDYDIDPADATDVLGRASIDGAAIAGAAGDEYRLTDTGSSLTIQATAANLWTVVSHNGPITDVN
jgi:hypothetical protein